MKRALMLALILALSAGAAEAKSCKDSKTGKSIKCPPGAASVGIETHSLESGSGAPHDAQTGLPSGKRQHSPITVTKGPHCTKGKACGNACISVKDVCHKG